MSDPKFKTDPNIHLAVVLMLYPPFEPVSFDLVDSQEVIHRARSTFSALKATASSAKKRGYVFVWVYALDDHLVYHEAVGLVTRVGYLVEAIIRLAISRSQKFLRDVFFWCNHPVVPTFDQESAATQGQLDTQKHQ